MTADDLPAAFASLPVAWRECLSGWTPQACQRVVDGACRVSADRPIAPPDPFRALRLVPPDAARVVVFGQDPYPTPGQADGLAFSAERSSRPSLRRIFEVLEADRPGWRRPVSGRLDAWAAQGVLLLNPALTVEVGRKESHLEIGWQALTCQIVQILCEVSPQPAFLLWGGKAGAFFDAAVATMPRPPECVLRTRHPSNDFGRDFMREGSHFVATAGRVDWWCIGR